MAISIRSKIVIAQILLITLVSLFIYTYYPNQQKKLALQAVDGKITSISNMFSIGVGIGMGEIDFVAVSEALNWAHTDSAVVYISVASNAGYSVALFNPEQLKPPPAILGHEDKDIFAEQDRTIFYRTTIVYQDQPMGTLIIGYSLKNLDANLNRLKSTTLYFCLALFAAGVVLSILIASMISRNIMLLEHAVTAITGGAEDVRVNVTSNDEIGKLGTAFNQMLDKLEASRQELLNNATQLRKQNEELNQFSYVVSHDLKAPLRAIFKLSEWIEEDMGSNIPAEPKKNLQLLRGRVIRMESLINGLLEYSKIGRLDIAPEKIDCGQVIKDIVDLLNPPQDLVIKISPKMPLFKTRKIALQQVFYNLISNAIKYSRKQGSIINIDVSDKGNHFRFIVEDNGIGIDEIYHKKIFEIFQTLEARDKVEGTGIGLSIVKKNVEDMGGSICLESKPGIGSKFIFTWPKEITKTKNRY